MTKKQVEEERVYSAYNKGIAISGFKLYYRSIVIKASCYQHNKNHINQISGIVNQIKAYTSTVTNFVQKKTRNYKIQKRQHIEQMVLVKLDSCMQKNDKVKTEICGNLYFNVHCADHRQI